MRYEDLEKLALEGKLIIEIKELLSPNKRRPYAPPHRNLGRIISFIKER